MLSEGSLQRIHLVDDDIINWLDQMALKALTKQIGLFFTYYPTINRRKDAAFKLTL